MGQANMKKAPRWSAVTVAVLGLLANLRVMVFGFSLLENWVRLHLTGSLYFHYGYLAHAVSWILVSAVGIMAAGAIIWKPTSYDVLPISSLAVGLTCMSLLPQIDMEMAEQASRILGHADHSLADWDESHGRFPADERELRAALAVRPLHESAIFFQNGRPVPYDLQFVSNAVGPALEPVPPNPGTLIYAVTPDLREYWLVMSSLRHRVGGPVVLLHIVGDYEQGEIWMMNRKHHNPGEGYKPFIE
jgi:hypothetical protein